jgi:acyl transferase domain-containing protein
MTEAAHDFTEFLRTVPLSEPRTTVLSNVTGAALTAGQATDPGYWGRQLAGTVRFHECLRTLLSSGPAVVLTVDRDGAFTRLARSAARLLGTDPLVLDAFGDRTAAAGDEPRYHEAALARAWTAGVRLDLVPRGTRRVALPTYPFAAHRHWLETTAEPLPAPATAPPMRAPAATAPPRPAVAADGPAAPEAADDSAAPEAADDMAGRVVTIWQNAFGGPPLRLEDDFFELGGTSLQAAQLVAVINEELLLDVRLHDLYECPTLADFVARVRAAAAERDDATLLRLLDELEAEDAESRDG